MNRWVSPSWYTLLLLILLPVAAVPGPAQVTFSAPVSYPVGTRPNGIVTDDFNGDGVPDLAVANNGDPSVSDWGSISLLLGKGDGTFQRALDVSAGAFPAIIVSGEFNGDGKLDLFVEGEPSPSSPNVPWSVLLGNGDGTFGAPLQFALTNFAASVVVGDFNNDKKLDLAFIDTVSMSIEELLGNGDGTFQPAQSIDTSSPSLRPSRLFAADFNGDGISDLAAGSLGTVQVLMAKGDGTFGAPISISINGANIQELFATDVNLDGKADLLATSITSGRYPHGCLICTFAVDYHLEAHLSNGDGSFRPAPDLVTTSTRQPYLQKKQGDSIDYFALGDFDNDGKLDIAYQQSTFTGAGVSASLILIGGQGNGTFPINLGKINGSYTGLPKALDLNGDRLADLGAEPMTATTIGVILNTTRGFWLSAPAPFNPVRAGGSVTGSISVNPQNGWTNSVSLTCLAPQSAGIQCTLSSSHVAPGGSSTMTVTTTGNSASSDSLGGRSHFGWFFALCFPLATIVFGRFRFGSKNAAKGKLAVIAIGGLLLAAIVLQAACGGDNPPPPAKGTPSGTYNITVIGKAGTISRSTNVSLTVQ